MPGSFISPEGDLERIFVDDYAMIDQFAMTGSLWGWGGNASGRLGDNTIVSKSSPVQTVSGGTNWEEVSCAGTSTAAIKTDGTLWLWGQGSSGQLGDNSTTAKSSPVQTVSGGTNWRFISTKVLQFKQYLVEQTGNKLVAAILPQQQ
jgi:alpha-tubulin suppressor-like RCC1 family protein